MPGVVRADGDIPERGGYDEGPPDAGSSVWGGDRGGPLGTDGH